MICTAALRDGLTEATHRFRITVALYLANLAAAACLGLPMAVLLDTAIGHSTAAHGLEATFRLDLLIDLLRNREEAFRAHYEVLGLAALVYAVLSSVLSGGVIDILRGSPRSPFLPRFMGGCGRLALRYLRLLPYLAVVLYALYWLGRGLDRLILLAFDQSAHEAAAFWAMRGKQGFILLLLLLVAAIFDLARILTALEDRAHMAGALLTAAGFVARHAGSILALYGLLLILGLALFAPYALLAWRLLPAASIAGLFVAQQVIVLARHWLRVAGYGAILSFYRRTTGAPADDAGQETGARAAAAPPPPAARGGVTGQPRSTAAPLLLGLVALAVAAGAAPGRPAGSRRGAAPGPSPPPRTPASPPAAAEPGAAEGLSRRIVGYDLEATLVPERRTVTGRGRVTYRNDTRTWMYDLKFHLYPNAFSNTHSTYMRGVAWDDRTTEAAVARTIREGSWGAMQIQSVRLADGTDLTAAATIDDTVMSLPLPTPVRPGEAVRVDLAWETRLPRTIHRMGYWGEHYDIMQWFPKPGVFTDQGWKIYPFYRHSEFFADFGNYEVTLTAPERYRMEATGIPGVRRRNRDGTLSITYRARDVHDFAWVADPDARAARETLSEGPYAGRPVEIVYFHQPRRSHMAARVLGATRRALLYYGERFMPYPYPRVVIDDLPMGLGGGMEYPMLFTVSGAHWFLPRCYQAIEELTLHEFGHQYWYGIMATNEFEEPWMDEGINSYVTRRAMERLYGGGEGGRPTGALFAYALARILDQGLEARIAGGTLDLDLLLGFHETPFRISGGGLLGSRFSPFALNLPGLRDGSLQSARDGYAGVARHDPLTSPAWGFRPGSYYETVYDKTDLVLETLDRLLGGGQVERALREYVSRHRFAHPTTADFLAVLQEVAARARPGLDLRPYIEQLFHGTGTIDFAVAALRSREARDPVGLVPAPAAGQPPADRSAPPASASGPPGRFQTEVIVERRGEAVLPVEVVVRFENGEEKRERWDGRATWKRFTYETASQVESARVDPDGIYVLDLDVTNNGRTLDRQWKPVTRLAFLWLFWVQNYLQLAASLS